MIYFILRRHPYRVYVIMIGLVIVGKHTGRAAMKPNALKRIQSNAKQSSMNIVAFQTFRDTFDYSSSFAMNGDEVTSTFPPLYSFLKNKKLQKTKRFLSTETEAKRDDNRPTSSTTQRIQTAYQEKETDGVMEIAPQLLSDSNQSPLTASQLILSSLEAVSFNKGQTAAILNAILGACASSPTLKGKEGASWAWDIYTEWNKGLSDESRNDRLPRPDIVTYANVYTACQLPSKGDDDDCEFWSHCSEQVLDLAQRSSKKLGGTKRRKKLLGISRRKKGEHIMAKHFVHDLKSKYGDDFDILYENDHLLVINKPSGMVCFHSHKTTSGKISRSKGKNKNKNRDKSSKGKRVSDISLEDALIDLGIPLSTLNHESMGIVHRLDRGTSGCIVLAKNDAMHARLVSYFFCRQIQKSYRALVSYQPVFHEAEGNGQNMSRELPDEGVVDLEVGGRPAFSTYLILNRYGDKAIELEVETKTGRKHQVRVHCAHGLGRPILLDSKYGDPGLESSVNLLNSNEQNVEFGSAINRIDSDGQRFLLHASKLSIELCGIDVEAPVPEWWGEVVNILETSN